MKTSPSLLVAIEASITLVAIAVLARVLVPAVACACHPSADIVRLGCVS